VDITEQKEAEAAAAQATLMEGVILAARETVHLLSHDLQLPVGLLELLQIDPALPPSLRPALVEAIGSLATATRHINQLGRVVRVETKNTPIGPSLDLERSAARE
jgi:hypothetical protein